MKKVLFFTSRFPAHSETFVVRQIDSLVQRGFDVRIVSLLPGDPKVSVDPALLQQLQSRCHVMLQQKSGRLSKVLYRLRHGLRCFFNKDARASLNFSKFGIHSKELLLASIYGEQLKTGHDGFKADIIIAHFGTNAVLADKLRQLKLLSGKLFAVFHGFDISSTELVKQYRDDYKTLFASDVLTLPVSELWAEKLVELGCPRQKIQVHRMGIDTDCFVYQENNHILTQPLKVLSVARLTEKKGLIFAIRAIAELVKRNIKVTYKIIGTGPLLQQLEHEVEQLNLSEFVEFAGFQNQTAIHSALQQSDVFLLPSVTAANGDMEGVPVSLMEAMAKGVICLSTYHSGIPELIEDKHSGLLVPERDSNAIADAMISLLEMENVNLLRQQARRTIESRFNQHLLAAELASLIDGCVNEPS
tara:strand:+ start:4859 stop:6106 length:1248 start_codon:yes stop_codon:yes gene_type:complete